MDALGVVMPVVAAGSLAAAIFAPIRHDDRAGTLARERSRRFSIPRVVDDRLIRRLSRAPKPIRANGTAASYPHASRPTWPSALSIASGDLSEYERHAVLHLLALESDGSNDVALCRAYAEENARGRLLALAALSRSTSEPCRAIVLNALHRGSDDERALTIDLLADAGRGDLLVAALDDPLDAVAARAALGFVGTRSRSEFERILAPHVTTTRLHAILALLDGALW